MPFGALLFLIGSGIAISRCSASPREVAASEICVRRFNIDEEEAGLIMFVSVGADEYEVVSDEKGRCLVDCVAHEAGFLDANDKFTVSEFIQKELEEPHVDERETKDGQGDYKVLTECAETVENWDGWDRTAKCQKGYLFFKCKSYGVDGFKLYMNLQRKLASGELKRRGEDPYSTPEESDSDAEESDSGVAVGTVEEKSSDRNRSSTEATTSQGSGVTTEGLSARVRGLNLNEVIPPNVQLNTPKNI